jgi:hypothetical protein
VFAPSYPLWHAFWHDTWSSLGSNSIMFRPWVSIWLIIQLIFPTFQLSSLIFVHNIVDVGLGLLHFSIIGILWHICKHPIDFMGVHLLCCTHDNECIRTHDAICDTFVVIVQNFGFYMGWKQLMCFFQSFLTPFIKKSTLCPPKMNLHLDWCCHCWLNVRRFISLILHNSRICYLWCNSKQRKELLQLTPHWSISNGKILTFSLC